MKITVLGAGAIGSAVAYDLCHRASVARVQVCEARPSTLRAFEAQHRHQRLRTFEADARDASALEPILAGSDCVVSCVGAEHSARLAHLAVDLGAHFVDLGGPVADAVADAAAWAEAAALAERRSRWIVSGAGLAPGLVNLLVMRALDRLDAPRAVRVLVGDVPTHPREPFGYRLAHSAEKLVDDYTRPVPVLRDGAVAYCPPLSGVEAVHVDGLGPMEAFYAGGLDSLAEALAGRLDRLDAKTLRYPGHAEQMRFLLDLGFADRTSLDVRTHLTYRDVLLRRLRQRLGGAYEDAVAVRVEADGTAGDADGTLAYGFVDHYDAASGLSAMQRCTGFPAAAAALLLAERAVPGGGVGPAEAVLPVEPMLALLAERGLVVDETWAPAAGDDTTDAPGGDGDARARTA